MANKFSLLQYSTAAVALLGVTAASSQVVYTDIDPDVVLDEPDEMFGIDLDDDGLNDFNFFNESFTTTVFYGDLANVKALFVGAFDTMLNGIAGSTGFLSGGGGYTYYRPYIIQDGEIIGGAFNFYNNNYQTLAMEIDEFSSPFPPTHNGNWYYFYGGEVIEKFLGISFTDEDNIKRYGWIRCSVIDSGRTLIIHDYAYELQPDYPIIAGDTVSYVDIKGQPSLVATVYSFNKAVYINLQIQTPTQLTIVDLNGQTILAKTLPPCKTLYAMLRSHRTVKHIWFFADTQSQLKKTKRA
jgi:hypothetical protein